MASILGNFTWAVPTIPFAQAHYRSMQRFYIKNARKNCGDLNAVCFLSDDAKADLEWWVNNLASLNGKCFSQKIPDLEIFSDASLTGWGAVCNGVTTRGPWTKADTVRHINELELLGALYALQSYTVNANGLSVRLFLDNTTAIAYINKCGGTRSSSLSSIAGDIIRYCEERKLGVEAFHLAGAKNVVADTESRAAVDAGDWKLDPDLASKIFNVWHCDIDLFSSAWNAQLPAFVSWRPQPGAYAVNAFSLNWGSWRAYLFPPFALILRCLAKIRRDRANVVFICPAWPTQPWFPDLLEMVIDFPRVIPWSPNLLTAPLGELHPLVRSGSISLTAWKLSGIPSESKAFRNKWSTSCWPATGQTPTQHTGQPGAHGLIGVFDSVRIHGVPL